MTVPRINDIISNKFSPGKKNRLDISDNSDIKINAEEIRQFLYCKRIPYWRRIARISGKTSYLMDRGSEYHKQRTSHTYEREGDLDTIRDQYFYDADWNVGAKVDVVRIRQDEIIPVEFKRFLNHRKSPFKGHIIQLVLGGMVAERVLDKKMWVAEIQYFRGIRSQIDVTQDLRNQVTYLLKELRNYLRLQQLPPYTEHNKKCVNCEFWKVCYRT